MDTQTIDQEYEKLQTEFQDVAGSVKALATKLQTASDAGDTNAAEWINDLKLIASDIDEEQGQAHSLLLAIHGFITNVAQAQAQAPAAAPASAAEEKPPLFAPGQAPQDDSQTQQPAQHRGMLGGMFGGGMGGGMMGGGMMGGGMMGGGMMGGYGGGGFARAMEMGMGMSLGANLLGSIFR
jgi:hypothetical protein